MNKRVIIILSAVVVLILLAAMKLMSNQEKVKKKLFIHDATAEVYVESSSPVTHTFENALSFLGTFEPVRQNTIGSDASGKIIKLAIEEGSRVSQGQLIAKVDDEMLQLQLQNAEISIEGQENDDKRYTNLANENAVAGVQVEKTKLGLRSAQVQKKQIQKQLRSTNIVAPFSGVVTKKMVDLGSVIGPGTQLVELTDISSLKLTVSVPERDIMKFRVGQSVNVFVDIYNNKSFSGKVTNINVQADKSHNFKVQITVKNPNSQIMSGMYGSVKLSNTKSITALSIPRRALVGSSKNPRVYVIRDGKAVLVSFTAGTSDGEYIEVVSGLTPKDQIVVKGQVNLQNNAPVTTKMK
jgi:RND family efflux transporter MFP subunit